jgi:hypothetical protein
MTQQAQLQVDGGDNSSSTSSVGAQVVAGGNALPLVNQIEMLSLRVRRVRYGPHCDMESRTDIRSVWMDAQL